MQILNRLASVIMVVVGFALFVLWLAFWTIPRNIIGEIRSYGR